MDVDGVPPRILKGILALFFVIGVYTVLVTMMGSWQQSDHANCPGYVDSIYGGLYSYNASLPTTGLAGSCLLAPLVPGLVALMFFIGFIYYVIYGRTDTPSNYQVQ